MRWKMHTRADLVFSGLAVVAAQSHTSARSALTRAPLYDNGAGSRRGLLPVAKCPSRSAPESREGGAMAPPVALSKAVRPLVSSLNSISGPG